ncbi:peptidylprolyl isomerase [Blochmannia endosymbiont of Colobopsis nipponica]|uniref:peptidylprolyl isomerase n=1 Tax=Blochmannia endosymbiont of Colobopsis nipponica TaxID=2681987 RepID=UPI00178745A7|nr:peptidylprolyl isomerase [Blochmannia endosymbiont of Colobopsis nipponica]QOI11279.1 peptidylprolyl isomerase [Blochmannia endosymbiont of Colobopsis nipponica]
MSNSANKDKKKIILLHVISIILIINNVQATPMVTDKIIAIVNNNIILNSDINKTLTIKKQNSHFKKELSEKQISKKDLIEQLIIEELIMQIAEKLNIKINNNDLDKIINEITIKQNIKTIKQLYNYLPKYDNVSYDDYKSQIRKEIIVSELHHHEMQQRVNIFPHQINKLAKRISTTINNNIKIQLSHIVITIPKNDKIPQIKQAESFAIKFATKMKKQVNIDELIKIYSNNKITIQHYKINGKLEELPTFITKNLLKIKTGNIIGPIINEDKFHILQINNIYIDNKEIFGTEVYAKEIFLKHSTTRNDQQTYTMLSNVLKQIKNKKITFDYAIQNISENNMFRNENENSNRKNIEDFDPNIRNILTSLNENEISDPIRTNYGWHVVKVYNIYRVNNIQSIQKSYAYYMLYHHKSTEEIKNWIQELHINSYVKILTNSIK